MKSIDVVNAVIAKNKNIDTKLVASINKYYWKTVRRKVSNLESMSVFVKGLLTFMASKYNVNRLILKTIRNIRMTRSSKKFGEEMKKSLLGKNFIHLKLLLNQRNKLAKHYYEHYRRLSKADTIGIEELP